MGPRRCRCVFVAPVIALAAWLLVDPCAAHGGEPGEQAHWAFVPPSRPAVPGVSEPTWVRNPIDAFIAAGRAEHGLPPAEAAPPATLLRRLCYDLTGLPPSIEEVEAFLADPSPDAYERQVDRLLASPRHGERRAQHWLDLARYADTDGFEFDQARPNAWRYRDWVVRAFNADMPYDRFIRLQLAADELDDAAPDDIAATGFNRCYPDMVDLNDQGLRRQNALDDMTETTSLVFLGLTLGCARCHDHKFDPLTQRDFYRLQAVFTPAEFVDEVPIGTPEELRAWEREQARWRGAVAGLQRELIRLEAPVRERLAPGTPAGLDDPTAAAFQKPEAERSSADVGAIYEALRRDKRLTPARLREQLAPGDAARHAEALERLGTLRANPPAAPRARGLRESTPTAPPTFLRVRGSYEAPGPEVQPGIPAVLRGAAGLVVQPTDHSSGRRRALAAWLTRPDNPLVARVIVNRLWQRLFGRGLVATPSDFGTMGEAPSHPLLLDWLATELVARGWSLKAIQRLIVTSATYRQASTPTPRARELDPDNLLVSHQNRRRLDGEAIRDALLAASGRLDATMFGPGVFPELPRELTRLSSKGDIWPVSPRARDRDRRSLYVFVRRNLRYPFFESFDRPDTNASCPQRPVSTVAPQALALLNGTLANDAALALAGRLGAGGGDEGRRIERAFLLAYGRRPVARELELARSFLAGGSPDDLALFCLALINANEFLYID
jgi:hypothetical protein